MCTQYLGLVADSAKAGRPECLNQFASLQRPVGPKAKSSRSYQPYQYSNSMYTEVQRTRDKLCDFFKGPIAQVIVSISTNLNPEESEF